MIDALERNKLTAEEAAKESLKYGNTREPKAIVRDGIYVRAIPERFSAYGDDSLMRHILLRYALEKADMNGKPSGRFYVDRQGAYELAMEVILTQLGFSGQKAIDYFRSKVPAAWQRWDVNNEGVLEAERGPTFLRFSIGNPELALNLQA